MAGWAKDIGESGQSYIHTPVIPFTHFTFTHTSSMHIELMGSAETAKILVVAAGLKVDVMKSDPCLKGQKVIYAVMKRGGEQFPLIRGLGPQLGGRIPCPQFNRQYPRD